MYQFSFLGDVECNLCLDFTFVTVYCFSVVSVRECLGVCVCLFVCLCVNMITLKQLRTDRYKLPNVWECLGVCVCLFACMST